jgi:hypothetical protein
MATIQNIVDAKKIAPCCIAWKEWRLTPSYNQEEHFYSSTTEIYLFIYLQWHFN